MRQRTAAAHTALEKTPLMRAFEVDGPSARQYSQYLAPQLRLHAPLWAEAEDAAATFDSFLDSFEPTDAAPA